MDRAPEDRGDVPLLKRLDHPQDRKTFLKLSGGSLVMMAAIGAGCDDDGPIQPEPVVLDFSNDFGVLNYAYALEQLEAAFYARVTAESGTALSAAEMGVMTEVRDHEIVHRDFLAAALGGNAIPALEVDFSAVDFQSRTSVLATARTFEDLGVAAYNGAGQLLSSGEFLLVAGKIVSVEARHAAAIRDLIEHGAFAVGEGSEDVVDQNGLDRAFDPTQVLQAADPFITTQITVRGL